MTLFFALCIAWAAETGTCAAAAVVRAEATTWSALPCQHLCPASWRPRLVWCVKGRGVAT